MFKNLNYSLYKEIVSPEPALSPPYKADPEGFCTGCGGFTTNYNYRGECREHSIAVTEDVTEVEEEC